jgi:hypothetical protein
MIVPSSLAKCGKSQGLAFSASGVASRMKATPSGKEIVISTTLVIFTAPTCQFQHGVHLSLATRRGNPVCSDIFFMAPSNKRRLPFIRSALPIDRLRLQAGAQLKPPFDSVVAGQNRRSTCTRELKRIAAPPFIRVAGRSIEG